MFTGTFCHRTFTISVQQAQYFSTVWVRKKGEKESKRDKSKRESKRSKGKLK